jgi:hypothetical protein
MSKQEVAQLYAETLQRASQLIGRERLARTTPYERKWLILALNFLKRFRPDGTRVPIKKAVTYKIRKNGEMVQVSRKEYLAFKRLNGF